MLSVLSVFHTSYCARLFTMCAVVYFAMYVCTLLFYCVFCCCVFDVSMLFAILLCCLPYYLACYLNGLVLFRLRVLRFPCLLGIVVGWHVCNL